jgi:hypothetical protein
MIEPDKFVPTIVAMIGITSIGIILPDRSRQLLPSGNSEPPRNKAAKTRARFLTSIALFKS